ncbi:hypothetical protein [Natrialba sp. INN-245]|uniref:hypothetical protein n=1 Tax=Natrialba sp. INN-245 TaxID=2690967 RepID=UPI0031B69B4A
MISISSSDAVGPELSIKCRSPGQFFVGDSLPWLSDPTAVDDDGVGHRIELVVEGGVGVLESFGGPSAYSILGNRSAMLSAATGS